MKSRARPTPLPDDDPDVNRWRHQHIEVERVADRVNKTGEPLEHIIDSDGNRGYPFRSISLLTSMARNGRISIEERLAGEDFHKHFTDSGHQPLRASDPGRVNGCGFAPAYRGSTAAQRMVSGAIDALGGLSTLGGSCAWYVLGLEYSLTVWAGEETIRRRPVTTQNATGTLIATLGVLQKYFGY